MYSLPNRSITSTDRVYIRYATRITADSKVMHELIKSELYEVDTFRTLSPVVS